MKKRIPFWISKNFIIDQHQSTSSVQDCPLQPISVIGSRRSQQESGTWDQIANMDTIWGDKRKHLHFSFKVPKRFSLPVGISALFETPFLLKATVVPILICLTLFKRTSYYYYKWFLSDFKEFGGMFTFLWKQLQKLHY